MVKLTLLDGDKTVGGAKFLVESDETAVLLDFGLNFGPFGKLFGEFLQPRACRGLHDLWKTGLIPQRRGLYRFDLLPPDLTTTRAPTLRPDAVLISHAHLDHIGLLGAIAEEVPIVCTSTTAMIMKSLQDTGTSMSFQEYAYAIPRALSMENGTLKASSHNEPAAGRPLMTFDSLPNQGQAFWASPPNPTGRQIMPARANGNQSSVGTIGIKHHPVDHSIPGCAAIELSCEKVRIVYTGDLRFHGRRGNDTQAFVDAMATSPPDVLIVEGTRIGRPPGPNVTEAEVGDNAWRIVRGSAGRLVVADFGGRHMERLRTFLEIARATGRILAISTRDAHLLQSIALTDADYDLLDDPHLAIQNDPKASERVWDQVIRADHRAKMVTAAQIARDPGAFILALSLWDMPEALDLALRDGVLVYSGSEAYGEDSRLNLYQLSNWVGELGMELHGYVWQGDETGRPVFTPGLNASGHIDEVGLEEMLLAIGAPVVVPVHTEHHGWFGEKLKGTPSRVALAEPDGSVTF